jgi:16S rRNA (uracil1498-N3)-methyltransferase
VPRVVVRPDAIAADRVRFDAGAARHLGRVLRLRPGALVEATDGAGRLYAVRLVALDPRGAWGAIEGGIEPRGESPCAITLASAILKGDRMSWLVQKATELGVARIIPVETARVVARPEAAGRPARWARIAHEAVEQCGRVVAPAVDSPCSLADVLGQVDRYDAAWLFWERGGPPMASPRTGSRPTRVLLLVGPEGGFTDDEVARAESAGVRLASLGPRILRAESAGLVAVVLAQYLFGDLQGESGPPAPFPAGSSLEAAAGSPGQGDTVA